MLVSGANHSGKTRLSCAIANILHNLGYTVIAIDVSGVWRKIRNLPHYAKAYDFGKEGFDYPRLEGSGVYDLSNLKLSESRQIVERICSEIWNKRINKTDPNNLWLICEESETYLRNMRGEKSEEFYRLVHLGRNINVRTILITTDLALLDASIIRLYQIRFNGLLGIEENAKRKFRAYYGKEITEQTTQLETGQFLGLHKKQLEFIKVREFQAKRKPSLYLHFEREQPKAEPQRRAKPRPQRRPIPKPKWLNNLLTLVSHSSREKA